MPESARQQPRREGNHRFRIVMCAVAALAAVSAIVVVVLSGGSSPRPSGITTAAGSSAGATHPAVQAPAPPEIAAAQEADLGGAVTPANSLRVAAWSASHGGKASRAVSAQLGIVLMMHDAKEVVQMRQACQVLAATVTAARTATPIPDKTMQLWYTRALTEIGAGAADCHAGHIVQANRRRRPRGSSGRRSHQQGNVRAHHGLQGTLQGDRVLEISETVLSRPIREAVAAACQAP